MGEEGWIPDDDWRTVVRHVPVVSVDLVVLTDRGVVLGKRANEPAKGEWFVPGGRVHKNERLDDAVRRVAREELGTSVSIAEFLGVYEHFYDVAEVPVEGGKHYVAHGYVVSPEDEVSASDDQHEAVRTFEDPPADVHEYTRQYLLDAGVVDPE